MFRHGSLVPADVFVRELAVAEAHNGDQRHFDTPVGGRDAGQHPGHLLGVGKTEDHFVHKLVLPYGSRDRSQCSVGWHGGDETLRIEIAQGCFTVAAGEYRDVVHVGVVDHGGEGGLGVASGELMVGVFLPEAGEVERGVVRHGCDSSA